MNFLNAAHVSGSFLFVFGLNVCNGSTPNISVIVLATKIADGDGIYMFLRSATSYFVRHDIFSSHYFTNGMAQVKSYSASFISLSSASSSSDCFKLRPSELRG